MFFGTEKVLLILLIVIRRIEYFLTATTIIIFDIVRCVSEVYFVINVVISSPGILPYESDGGARGKFSKKIPKGTRITFRGRGFDFIITPKRYQLSNNIFFLIFT